MTVQLPDDLAAKVRAERKKMAAFVEACAADLRDSANAGAWTGWAFDLSRVANALRNCGSRATGFMLFDHAPEKNAATRHRCRNRLCPFCHAVGASRVADSLERLLVEELDKGSELAMLTLTVRHKPHEPLKLVRKTLDRAWAMLTKRTLWKSLVKDYHRKAELERTVNGGWHPHFHVLMMPIAELRERVNEAWRAGTLKKHPLFKWWVKYRRKRGLDTQEASFVTFTKSDVEDWLRWEWREVTAKLSRRSENIRLEFVKPVKGSPGMVWGKSYDAKSKTWRPVAKPIRKVAQEMAKYDTKRSAAGSKKGQVGIYDYSPSELSEYLRGMKNWHLHQSSKGWSKITKAYEQADEERDAEQASLEGGHYVPYVELVKDAQDAVAGRMPRQLVLAFELDALAILDVLEREHKQDPDFSPQQAKALRSHLGRLYGDDQAELVEFPLCEHQQHELARRRGRYVESRRSVTIEVEEVDAEGRVHRVKKKLRGRQTRVSGDFAEDVLIDRAADEAAREAAAELAQRELFAELFTWPREIEQQLREMQHA